VGVVAHLTAKQRYKKTPKGRATAARYKRGEAGRAAATRYRQRNIDKLRAKWREAQKKYRQTERGRRIQAAYRIGPGKLVNLKSWLKNSYNITLERYQSLVAAQNNKCALCGKSGDTERFNRLSIDHCHKTDLVRGLLCERCNLDLGIWEKLDHERIKAYLDDHHKHQLL
jgi:hypothetical protein